MDSKKYFKLPQNGSQRPAILALFAATGAGAFYLYKKKQNPNWPKNGKNGHEPAVYTVPPPTGEADFKMQDLIKSKMPKASPTDDQKDGATNNIPKL